MTTRDGTTGLALPRGAPAAHRGGQASVTVALCLGFDLCLGATASNPPMDGSTSSALGWGIALGAALGLALGASIGVWILRWREPVHAHLREALDTFEEAYLLLDDRDQVIYFNEEFRRQLSPYDAVLDAPNLRFSDVVRVYAASGGVGRSEGIDVENYPADRLERHDNPRGTFELERLPSGRWVRVREQRLPNGGTFLVSSDISELKQLQQALREHQEGLEVEVRERTAKLEAVQSELIRNERLATIGQLTGTVSHELRNPLGSIRTSFDTVRRALGPNPEPLLENAFNRIDRNIDRCVLITDELLDFARTLVLRPQPTDIRMWLDETLSECAIPAQVDVTVTLDVPHPVVLDPTRTAQALINVVTNALQAMTSTTAPILAIEAKLFRGRFEISVRDNGESIPASELDAIFDPLYSTRPFGVGLGLALVRKVIEGQGGGVEAHSSADIGTTMVLWLPSPGHLAFEAPSADLSPRRSVTSPRNG